MSGSRSRRACTKHVSYNDGPSAVNFTEKNDSDAPSKDLSGDVRMGGSSDDEGEAGGNNNNKNSDDFLKFAFAHRSDSSKGASNKAGTSNKASLRAQLSEALSGKKSGNKSRKVGGPNEDEDAEEQEYSEEEGSEDDEEIKVPSKRRGVPTREQRMNTRPKSNSKRARKSSDDETDEAEGSSDNEDDDFANEGPSKPRRTTASEKSSALEEMQRRRAKGRASDDHCRALELALSGGAEVAAGTSSGGSRGKSAEQEDVFTTKRGRVIKNGNSNVIDVGDSEDDEEYSDEEDGSEEEESEEEDEDTKSNTKEAKKTLKALKKHMEQAQQILTTRRVQGKIEYLVKFRDASYRRLEWIEGKILKEDRKSLVFAYHGKFDKGTAPTQMNSYENGVCPEWMRVERIASAKGGDGAGGEGTKYLVKWEVLSYQECTWESAEDLAGEEDAKFVEKYWQQEKASEKKMSPASPQVLTELLGSGKGLPEFLNGRKLRDYQEDSFKWMVQHALTNSSCILGDEMGLGKTAQSIAVMEFLRVKARVRDPMLIVAPLTTLGHWRREIETWTTMNCVCYTGGKDDRVVIDKYELWRPKQAGQRGKKPKFEVILTSFETLRDCGRLFESIAWSALIVDEAHRLKSIKSAVRQSICALNVRCMLLLTGTPIQNNMSELFSIMNLVEANKFPDLDNFLARFGDPVPTPDQLRDLQECLRPILLRRMKEDVETLPEKEEVIIWVELTMLQREYYKALYEKDIASLLTGVKNSALPGMRNLAMELRKLCCHPFLCNGIEDDMVLRLTTAKGKAPSRPEALEAASGKLLLVRKLLTKLRSEKRRVLIFSQFKIMLDILEEMIEEHLGLPYERLDGDTKGPDRQTAMDRFQTGGDDVAFAFLLSTKAGGQGITLTAADTIVLYDSDWNPQNDLQAMARAHRIGQTNEVTIYRLVTKNTYEESLINVANKKGGLNEAILGNLASNTSDDPQENAAMISRLLKEGAHSLLGGNEEEAKKNADKFESEDIGNILAQRTSKRIMRGGGKAGGGTFSVANFKGDDGLSDGAQNGAGESADFWRSLLPDAVKAAELAEQNRGLVSGPRRRRAVNYNEEKLHKEAEGKAKAEASNSGSSSYSQSGEEEDEDDQEYSAEGTPRNPTNAPTDPTAHATNLAQGEHPSVANIILSVAMQANRDAALAGAGGAAVASASTSASAAAKSAAIKQAMQKAQMASMIAGRQGRGPRDDVPLYNDRVQDIADALLNRFGPAHIDLVLAALSNESLTQSAILPNHSDYLASRLRALMKEGGIPAYAMRKFFKTWVDMVRACTAENPTLYPSAVEASLRAMGQTVAPNPAQQGFPPELTLSADETLSKRSAETVIRKIRKKRQTMESAAAAAAGSDPAQLPEAEAKQLVQAEKVAEQLRHKEAEQKRKHLDDINTFLLAATKLAWPNKHQSLVRQPWKSSSTLAKKTLAEAAKNAKGRLGHWHSLDTLHNILTQNPDTPIHNSNTHTHTFQWNSPVSPQLISTSAHPAAPAAVAVVQQQQRQAVAAATAAAAAAAQAPMLSAAAAAAGLPQGIKAGPGAPTVPSPAAIAATAPSGPPLDISGALMKKAEMLTRVNKISAELAHRAQQRLDAPASQFTAIKFFLAAIQKAVDNRKDEEWLQARLLVALLAVGGEPVWGRGTAKANVEAVGYVYQLLTIKVVDLSSFPEADPGLLKPDAQFIKTHGVGTEKWAMLVHKKADPSLPCQEPVWLSVELAQWLQRDLSSCAYTLLSFLMSEVRRIEAVKSAPAASVPSAAGTATAGPAASAAPAAGTAAGDTAALRALVQQQPAAVAAAVQHAAGAVPLVTGAAKAAAAGALKVGEKQTAPIEVSSSSADAANAEGDGEEEDEEERTKLRTQTGGTGKGAGKQGGGNDDDDDDDGNSRDGTGGQKQRRDSPEGGNARPRTSTGKGPNAQRGSSAKGGDGGAGPAANGSGSGSPQKKSLERSGEESSGDRKEEQRAVLADSDMHADSDQGDFQATAGGAAKKEKPAATTKKTGGKSRSKGSKVGPSAGTKENTSVAGNSATGDEDDATAAAKAPIKSGTTKKRPASISKVARKSDGEKRKSRDDVKKQPTLSAFLKPVRQ